LARPAVQYRDSYLAATRELLAEGVRPPWNLDRLEEDFAAFVQVLHDREHAPLPGYVPQTDYWLIVAGEYAGSLDVRHRLTPDLERYGGHIGYHIRPARRRQGYGTLQCRLGIAAARSMGLGRLLITCDDDNIGSYKIIEACGGVLWDRVDNGRHVLTRRYWIPA
jgi:predicted acetyltransferase